jgi:hypothetical protein
MSISDVDIVLQLVKTLTGSFKLVLVIFLFFYFGFVDFLHMSVKHV